MIYWEKGNNTFMIEKNFTISLDLIWKPYTGNDELFFGEKDSDLLPHEKNIPNFTLQGFKV